MKKIILMALLFVSNFAYAQDKLVIASSNRGNFDTTFSEFAKTNGFLDKCGVNIEHYWTSSGTESLQTVLAGSADISLSVAYPTAIGVFQKGGAVRVIGSSFIGNDAFWYVKESSNIRQVKDLVGKKVAYGNTSSHAELTTKSFRKNSGVGFEGVATGGNMATNFTLVMTNQVDAGLSVPPTLVDKIFSKEIRVIAFAKDYAQERNEATTRVIAVNADSITKKRKHIECWMRGVSEAIDYFYKDHSAVEKYAKLVNFSVDSVKYSKEVFSRSQFDMFSLKGVEQSTKDGIEIKVITTPLTQEQFNEFYIKVR
jgi:ABC-type nitrate/sulfonate/bicarbonate transport system substrate-binding protein